MTSNFKFAKSASITRFNPPGAYAIVVSHLTEINGGNRSYFYELEIAGESNLVKLSADTVHAQYMKTPNSLQQVSDDAFDPQEPQDPNFDQNGFPIYKPDYI